jgi:hypothetical protein
MHTLIWPERPGGKPRYFQAKSTTARQHRVADGPLVVPRAPNTEGSKVTGGRTVVGLGSFQAASSPDPFTGQPLGHGPGTVCAGNAPIRA